MKRDPNLSVIGEDSLCVNCQYSKIITVRAEPHPGQIHQFMQEHPGREPPPPVYHVESLCMHRVFTGINRPARLMGTVVECELFGDRGIPTKDD